MRIDSSLKPEKSGGEQDPGQLLTEANEKLRKTTLEKDEVVQENIKLKRKCDGMVNQIHMNNLKQVETERERDEILRENEELANLLAEMVSIVYFQFLINSYLIK